MGMARATAAFGEAAILALYISLACGPLAGVYAQGESPIAVFATTCVNEVVGSFAPSLPMIILRVG